MLLHKVANYLGEKTIWVTDVWASNPNSNPKSNPTNPSTNPNPGTRLTLILTLLLPRRLSAKWFVAQMAVHSAQMQWHIWYSYGLQCHEASHPICSLLSSSSPSPCQLLPSLTLPLLSYLFPSPPTTTRTPVQPRKLTTYIHLSFQQLFRITIIKRKRIRFLHLHLHIMHCRCGWRAVSITTTE